MNDQVDDVIGHILNSIKDAGLKKDPFPHFESCPVFPGAYYKELLANLPDDDAYTPAGDIPELCPKGRDAVRKFYADFVASGAFRLELDIDRLVVDHDCVFTEGVMRMAYPGATLALMSHEVDDPEAYYLFEDRMAGLWPMDENGKIQGEDTYSVGLGFEGIAERKISLEDVMPLEGEAA